MSPSSRQQQVLQRLEHFRDLYGSLVSYWESRSVVLEDALQGRSGEALKNLLLESIRFLRSSGVPTKEIKYLFYWLIREGGQRLEGDLGTYLRVRSASGDEGMAGFLAEVYEKERSSYRFSWDSLEGTFRERIKRGLNAHGGIQLESIVRDAVSKVLSNLASSTPNIRRYSVERRSRSLQGFLGRMTYDVIAEMELGDGTHVKLVFACKGRGTRGGGHAAIFTRDLVASSLNVKVGSDPHTTPFVIAIVVAESWGQHEHQLLERWFCDKVIYLSQNQRQVIEAGVLPDQLIEEIENTLSNIAQGRARPSGLRLERIEG